MFLTKALNSATAELSAMTCRARHGRADDKRRSNDDHDVVGKPGKRLVMRDNAGGDGNEQCQDGDEVITQPAPVEHRHHPGDDGKGDGLLKCHDFRWSG